MKFEIKKWSTEKIFINRDKIQFPEYQREPNVWGDEKRSMLIDSMINDIPIPPLFMYKQGDSYECVDGRQRLQSVWAFFDGDLKVKIDDVHTTVDDFPKETLEKIKSFEIPFFVLQDIEKEYLSKIFLRLQIATPLNAGEKLNAAIGDMKNFVFKTAKVHEFFKQISIPSRRFSKEQVLSQICINSFSRALRGRYESARFERLLSFFNHYEKLDKYSEEIDLIKKTLDLLHVSFKDSAKELTNRALVLTCYLFFEKMIVEKKEKDAPLFAEFYLEFINIMKREAKKGLDYDPKFRKHLDVHKYVIEWAFEPRSIERREELIRHFFEKYKDDKKKALR